MKSQLSETIRIPQATPTTETPLAYPSINLSTAAFQCPMVSAGKYNRGWLHAVPVDRETGYRYVRIGVCRRVCVYSENGQFIHEFGVTHLREPFGILIHQDSVYVTDVGHHAVFQFRIPEMTMVKTVGSQGYTQNRFCCPKNIAISPDQYLYIADQMNHRIQILTPDLKFDSSLRHYTMTNPIDVKFSNSEMFVLCSQEIPCIHVFSLSGEMYRTFEITENLGLKNILCFCLDSNSDIVMCDCRPDRMKEFSPKGYLLHFMIALTMRIPDVCFLARVKILKNNKKLICGSRDENLCVQVLSL